MVNFIVRKNSAFLSSEGINDAVPIIPLSKDTLEEWRTSLSPAQQKWLDQNNFKAKSQEMLLIPAQDGALHAVALGMGDKDFGPWTLATVAKSLPAGNYRIEGELEGGHADLAALGWGLGQYHFDHYLKNKKDRKAVLVLPETCDATTIQSLIRATGLVRDLVNFPTDHMGPPELSTAALQLADAFGADFEETVGEGLLERGFETIYTVGRAAAKEPRLIDLHWGDKDNPKLTLVGKGVCFDTGGLDIKPSSGMRNMKKDMGGAAHVLGLAQAIMEADLPVRLRVLIPAVENNISANAFRPGDIIRTYKGTTVEVGNTDAEGRLVLCDALTLACEDDPDLLLDFATLTGAARVALGTDVPPFFTDNDALARDLAEHAEAQHDPLWRLPLYAPYEDSLKSPVADMSNMSDGPFGGAITAALYLKHFVDKPENWVHFDVFAWNISDRPGRPKGGEAMALRAVFSYLQERYGS